MRNEGSSIFELTSEQLELVSGGGRPEAAGHYGGSRDSWGGGNRGNAMGGKGDGFRGKGASGSWGETQGCTDTGWGVDAGVSVSGNIGVAKVEAHANAHYDSKTNNCGANR